MSGAVLRLLLFLLPFVLFFAWLWLMRHSRLGDGRIDPRLERRITGAGLGLIVVTVIGFVIYGLVNRGGPPEGAYVPATAVDGEVKPGRFEKSPDDDDAS